MGRNLQWIFLSLAFVASAVAWPLIPDRAPVHWNMAGQVDRYGGRLEVALLLPIIMLVLWGLMRFLPRIDPMRVNYPAMADSYELVISVILGTMLAVHAVVLSNAVGYPVAIEAVIPMIVGTAFIGLGLVIPGIRPNWWLGFRTPWTLSNERVWGRTHRVAGHSMVFAGAGFVIMGFVADVRTRLVILVVIGASVLVPVAYSYIIWRKETPD